MWARKPSQARLNNTSSYGSWSSRYNDLNQWLQVDLGAYFGVTRIATQGRYSSWNSQWVTKYRLQYSDDGGYFKFYKALTDTSPKVNYDYFHFVKMSCSTPAK